MPRAPPPRNYSRETPHPGIPQFHYLRQFLHWVQPHDFPLELVKDFLGERITAATFILKVTELEAGILVLVLLGALTAAAVPTLSLAGLLSAPAPAPAPAPASASRRPSAQRQAAWFSGCKRRLLRSGLQATLLLLALGGGGMLWWTEAGAGTGTSLPSSFPRLLEESSAFGEDASSRLRSLLAASLEAALGAADRDLHRVEELVRRPLQGELGLRTGVEPALEELAAVDLGLKEVREAALGVGEGAEAGEREAEAVRARLWELRKGVEATLRLCSGVDRPLCETLSARGLDLRLNTAPVLTDAGLAMLQSGNWNLSHWSGLAEAAYRGLPAAVFTETREARQGVSKKLDRRKAALEDRAESLETVAGEVSTELRSLLSGIRPYLEALKDASFWARLVGLAGGVTVVLVAAVVLGLGSGCCGSPLGSLPSLVTGLAGLSLCSLVVWAVGAGALGVGAPSEGLLCRPLYRNPPEAPFNLSLDLRIRLRQFRLPGAGGLLQRCEALESCYSAMGLRDLVDLDKELGDSAWAEVHTSLETVNVAFLRPQLLTPGLKTTLTDLLQALSLDLTSIRAQLGGPVTSKDMESFATHLESVSSQMSDLGIATHLETLASRCRRVVETHVEPLNQYKERLIYQLTALELKVIPLEKRVNQTLIRLKTIQDFIDERWAALAYHRVKEYRNRITGYLERLREHVLANLDEISCQPLWTIFDSARILLCRNMVDPLNGFWLISVWCLILLLIATLIMLKLINFHRLHPRFQGEMSPSEMFLTEEQTSGWSTPGQREGDGW